MMKKSVLLLLIGLTTASGIANGEERFALPASKSTILQCQKQALALHPGEITSEQTTPSGEAGSEIRFEIHDRESVDWVVFCDAVTGKITKDLKLEDGRK